MTANTATEATITFRAMATDVTISVFRPNAEADAALHRAQAVFERVEETCTRFVATSSLMRANADPSRWHDVPLECAAAIAEASLAYEETGGIFDPRILDALVGLGYDRSMQFTPGSPLSPNPGLAEDSPISAAVADPSLKGQPWCPRWEIARDACRVHLDGSRIDLGGIGKGLAVRWAARHLRRAGESAMVEAGGDCQFVGAGPDGTGWRVGMEDPTSGRDPLLVFELANAGCATSSIRLRRWSRAGREVHHLVDPRTGTSGGAGLLAVTVIHPDIAWAEVWSKTLFLCARDGIEEYAEARGLPAAWVDSEGGVQVNRRAAKFVIWAAPHVRSSRPCRAAPDE